MLFGIFSAPAEGQEQQLKTTSDVTSTILFKIITRMKLLFSNYLGHYSYSFQGSVELISITVTVSFFCAQTSYRKESPSGIFKSLLPLQLHNLMVLELKM